MKTRKTGGSILCWFWTKCLNNYLITVHLTSNLKSISSPFPKSCQAFWCLETKHWQPWLILRRTKTRNKSNNELEFNPGCAPKCGRASEKLSEIRLRWRWSFLTKLGREQTSITGRKHCECSSTDCKCTYTTRICWPFSRRTSASKEWSLLCKSWGHSDLLIRTAKCANKLSNTGAAAIVRIPTFHLDSSCRRNWRKRTSSLRKMWAWSRVILSLSMGQNMSCFSKLAKSFSKFTLKSNSYKMTDSNISITSQSPNGHLLKSLS